MMSIGLAEVAFIGGLFVLVNIPLAFGWVPRNRIYGFRVPATLRSDANWYAINKRYGRIGILIGAALAAMGMVLETAGFDTPAGRMAAMIVMAGALLAMTICGWRDANRMERG